MKHKIIQLTNNLSDSLRFLSNRKNPRGSLRVCSIYYQTFSALLYREAKALTKDGKVVDVLCYWTNRSEKKRRSHEGINIYPIQQRSSKETTTIFYLLRLFQFFAKTFLFLSFSVFFRRYKVIHVTTPPDFLVFAAIVPKMLGAKIIMDIHDIGPEFYMRSLGVDENHPIVKIIKFIEKIAARFSDHVIAVTDLWRDKLIERSTDPSKCTTLLNVPEDGLFKIYAKNTHKIPNNFNLYYHGSLEELFGVDTLIDAMPLIIKKIPKVKLNIYGGGRLLVEYKNRVKKYEVEEHVIFHDIIPFWELPRSLSKADIGIVPTKDEIFSDEILAMKSLEYIALGIPIVISRTKGHSYYYNPSMVKFFEPNNKDDLSRAVIELYSDEMQREKQINNSKHFIEKHGWKQTQTIYLKIVNSLIS